MEIPLLTRRSVVKGGLAAGAAAAVSALTGCKPDVDPQRAETLKKHDITSNDAGAAQAASARDSLGAIAKDVFQGERSAAEEISKNNNQSETLQVAAVDTVEAANTATETSKRVLTPEEARQKVRDKYNEKFLSHIPHDYLGLKEYLRKKNHLFTSLFSEKLVPWIYGVLIYDKQNNIESIAKEYGLSPNVMAVIMFLESNGRSNDKNPGDPAMGAMQVMPLHFIARDFPEQLKVFMGEERFKTALDYVHLYGENLVWDKEQNEWVARDSAMTEDVALLIKFMRDDQINLRVAARYIKTLFAQIEIKPEEATLRDIMQVVPAYHGGDSNLKKEYRDYGMWTKVYADRFAEMAVLTELTNDFVSLGQGKKVLEDNLAKLYLEE